MALNRTEEWRAAARAYAHRLGGLDPTSCTTMRLRPPPSSDFHLSARAVAAAVRELRGFVGSRRRDYCDPLRCSDTERAALECEVSDAVRDCRERIAGLTLAVPHAAADACGGGSPEGDVLAHHTGVVLILAERLAEAAGKFDRARAQRARLTLEAQSYRRRGATRPIEPVPAVSRYAQSAAAAQEAQRALAPQTPQMRKQMALDAEGHALAEELNTFVDQVRQAERSMVQVAALSQTFAAHVAAQAEQIEQLYTVACESSRNLERGNVELETTIRRSGGARRTVAILLLAASLMLLLLDWLSG